MATDAKTTCPRCGDTGWFTAEAGGLARRCECFVERQDRLLFERARLPKRYRECSFGNFDTLNESLGAALKLAKKFVKDYHDHAQEVGIMFIGPCGVGKTHLTAAILRELMQKKSTSCLFYDFRELIRDIQSTFNGDTGQSESDVLAPVFESEVLALDELGAKRSSAWVEETVFYIINHRYNHKRLTIFTSNYPDSEEDVEDGRQTFFKKSGFQKPGEDTLLDRIGVRLRSRIYEMCKVVHLEGDDYRRIAKQASYRF
jgi:DNA replication protein DnaC